MLYQGYTCFVPFGVNKDYSKTDTRTHSASLTTVSGGFRLFDDKKEVLMLVFPEITAQQL
jgi:hypothetical protein